MSEKARESARTTVWKYDVPAADEFTLQMPSGAEVLTVALQGTIVDSRHPPIRMWVRGNPAASLESRRFRFAGTGHPLDVDVQRYVGSVQLMDGGLVFHLFEMAGGITRDAKVRR